MPFSSIYPAYDVIVVGAGHAGSEAAGAAARMGCRTLLITMNLNAIAQMSCNPAMGGVAKGQIVREIDALGGLSGLVSDATGVQFRMLNRSKGPAMWSPRCQSDRMMYSDYMRRELERIPNLFFRQDSVNDLLFDGDRIAGVRTQTGQTFLAKAVVVTSGTFLNGLIHIGEKSFGGGRSGDRAATGITEALVSRGFEAGRLKTGTPPRIDGRTVDYSKFEIQHGDDDASPFSFLTRQLPKASEQLTCWIGHTNDDVHAMLRTGFDRSPMFNGTIKSIGPRYCPSIEDKINRFADKDSHQLFLEPEGWNTYEMYINGFSTSLPEDVQYKALRTVPGLENVFMIRPGYAIEYDYFPPHQIRRSLETKLVNGLFFAGQVNGTTGYEEAACQGLMAGINAALNVRGEEPLILKRSEAYIGVLIDDLVNKGTEEPYRMFTSRAEHRILLRQDNADLRLTEIGRRIGLVDDTRWQAFTGKKAGIEAVRKFLDQYSVRPEVYNAHLRDTGSAELRQSIKMPAFITRPEVTLQQLLPIDAELREQLDRITSDRFVIEQVEIQYKYDGYVQREHAMVAELSTQEEMAIPAGIQYHALKSLSTEGRIKLEKVRPETIGQASRISGVSASDIAVLMVYLRN